MKGLFQFCLFMFICMPVLCRADWMSDVDKRYEKQFPVQYGKVYKAQRLITSANGQTNQTLEALELLHSVLEENQNFAPAYVQIARAASDLGRMSNNRFEISSLKEMEIALQKAIEIEPNYDYAIALMGFAKMFQGDLDGAEAHYGQVERLGSGYPHLFSQLSQLAKMRGNYDLALKYALTAYEQNRDSPTLAAASITGIIYALHAMPGDRVAELEAWYSKRRELDPSAWNWQAHANFRLYYLGDYEKSIEYCKNALALMDFGLGRYTLAAAYYKKWSDLKDDPLRSSEAKQAYESAVLLYPVTGQMLASFDRAPALRSTADAMRKEATGMGEK